MVCGGNENEQLHHSWLPANSALHRSPAGRRSPTQMVRHRHEGQDIHCVRYKKQQFSSITNWWSCLSAFEKKQRGSWGEQICFPRNRGVWTLGWAQKTSRQSYRRVWCPILPTWFTKSLHHNCGVTGYILIRSTLPVQPQHWQRCNQRIYYLQSREIKKTYATNRNSSARSMSAARLFYKCCPTSTLCFLLSISFFSSSIFLLNCSSFKIGIVTHSSCSISFL